MPALVRYRGGRLLADLRSEHDARRLRCETSFPHGLQMQGRVRTGYVCLGRTDGFDRTVFHSSRWTVLENPPSFLEGSSLYQPL